VAVLCKQVKRNSIYERKPTSQRTNSTFVFFPTLNANIKNKRAIFPQRQKQSK